MLKNNFYSIFSIFIVITILISGCATQQIHTKAQNISSSSNIDKLLQDRGLHKIMYVTQSTPPFVKGEEVEIVDIQGSNAITEKGELAINLLEKEPSQVSLKVDAPEGAKVRILTIKPKYEENMYLKPGPYLLEITKQDYIKVLKWVTLKKNTILPIDLIKVGSTNKGSFTWNKSNLKTYQINFNSIVLKGKTIWHDTDHTKRYQWKEGQKVCSNVTLKLSKHYQINTFTIPKIADYEAVKNDLHLFEKTDFDKLDYWTSDTLNRQNIALLSPALEDTLTDEEFDKKHKANKMQISFYYSENSEFKSRPMEDYSSLMCVSDKYNFNDMTLDDLQNKLYPNYKDNLDESEKNRQSLQEAFHLKYGSPHIKSVTCKESTRTCSINIKSDRNDLSDSIEVDVDKKDFDLFIKAVKSALQPNPKVMISLSNGKPEITALEGLHDSIKMVQEYLLAQAYFSVDKLENLINKDVLDAGLTKKANDRILELKELFKGYEPKNDLALEGCHYYYPQNIIDMNTKKSLHVDFWDKISGKSTQCEKGLLQGKTTLYFFSEKGVYVKLKGEMSLGMFVGAVKYKKSKDPNHEAFTEKFLNRINVKKISKDSNYHTSSFNTVHTALQ